MPERPITIPPNGLSLRDRTIKRTFDVVAAASGLAVLSVVIVMTFVIATIDTRANGFYLQRRIGRWGIPFKVIKTRTMRVSHGRSTTVTTENDARITRVGAILRRLKLDELPQLANVLLGSMSIVGPRPDVPGFADMLEGSDRIILSVRPGITGPASLHFRNEEQILARQDDPERYNSEVIYPAKVRMNRKYVENYSFSEDLRLIWRTLFS